MAQESLPPNVVSPAQVRANVVNLLDIRDTELSCFLGVEEKRTKAHDESNVLFDYTRKPIQRLTYLNKVLAQLEDHVVPCETQMQNLKTTLQVMAAKEEQQYNKHEDKALAALATEDKKRQFAAAEKYIEEVLQCAL